MSDLVYRVDVREVMKLLGMNRNIKVVPWATDHVHYALFTDYFLKPNMAKHMFKNHIWEPAKRDLVMVASN